MNETLKKSSRKRRCYSIILKVMLVLMIFFAVNNKTLKAQSRLGSTAAEIRKEFSDSEFKLESGYTSDYTYYIKIKTSIATVIYYFDSKYICNLCMIIPDDQGSLNFYVEYYNNNYVIISSVKWKMYSEYGISNIELNFLDEGGYYFVWY